MNKRFVFYTLGRILIIESVLLLFPFVTGLIYLEKSAWWFLVAAVAACVCGISTKFAFRKCDRTLFAREGFAIVALSWIVMSLFGALPFYLSREIPSFTNAIFETVSGFTTTGASVLTNVEGLSHCMLFWRSFTHWIGGMGILVFMMAIMPSDSGRSVHIMKAEMPGPIVGKVAPKVKDTAKILYLVYIVMTLVQVALLWAGDMNLFESVVHSFGTAGTGGFGIKGDSLGSYSAYSQWVVTAFMFLFGINFNLYYLILLKRLKVALKSTELWCYVGFVTVAVIGIAVNIVTTMSNAYQNLSDVIRHSAFQTVSVITTTGYSTVDFNLWPSFSKMMLLLLMFVGGCAGSTAGGLKVSRIIIMFKAVGRDLKHLVHPRSVNAVRFEGKTLEKSTLHSVSSYIVIYSIIFFIITLLLSLEPFGFETTFSATAACFNNIGPGFAEVGPMGSYAVLSDFSKWLLSFTMLLGRLEIFPLLLAFSPLTWTRK